MSNLSSQKVRAYGPKRQGRNKASTTILVVVGIRNTHIHSPELSQFSVVMNEHRDYFFFDFMNIVFKRKLVSYLYSNVRRMGLAKFSKFKYLECINKQNLFHHYVNYINDIRIILKINYIFCCKNISYFPY